MFTCDGSVLVIPPIMSDGAPNIECAAFFFFFFFFFFFLGGGGEQLGMVGQKCICVM